MAEWTMDDIRRASVIDARNASGWIHGDQEAARRAEAEFDAALTAHDAEVRAQALRDYAASRYEAHLEYPSIPWPDQPSRMAQQYAMCAAELRAAADREAEGGAR